MLDPEASVNERFVDHIGRLPFLASVAKTWQPVVRSLLSRCDRRVQDALHGTFLGHPLHPVITDVPVGAWTVTATLDALELCGLEQLSPGADVALQVGMVAAVGAAVTGFTDWSDTHGDSRNVGMAHALVNTCALLCYLTGWQMRRTARRRAGIGWAMAGYGLAALAAYLGGELSFGMQVGSKRTASPRRPPTQFVAVCSLEDLQDGALRGVDAQGVPVLLHRRGSSVDAISAVCTHRGGPLADGTVTDGCVQCPWHGSVFRFSDGSVAQGPATFPVASYACRIVDGMVQVAKRGD